MKQYRITYDESRKTLFFSHFYMTEIKPIEEKIEESMNKCASLIGDTSKKISVMKALNTKADLNKERVINTKDINKAECVLIDKDYLDQRSQMISYVSKKNVAALASYVRNNMPEYTLAGFDDEFDAIDDDERVYISPMESRLGRRCFRSEGFRITTRFFIYVMEDITIKEFGFIGGDVDELNKKLKSMGFDEEFCIDDAYDRSRFSLSWDKTRYCYDDSCKVNYSTKLYTYDLDLESYTGLIFYPTDFSKRIDTSDLIIDNDMCASICEGIDTCSDKSAVSMYYGMIMQANFNASEIFIVWLFCKYEGQFEILPEYKSVKSKTLVSKVNELVSKYYTGTNRFDSYIDRTGIKLEELPELIRNEYIKVSEIQLKRFVANNVSPVVRNFFIEKHNVTLQ